MSFKFEFKKASGAFFFLFFCLYMFAVSDEDGEDTVFGVLVQLVIAYAIIWAISG